MMMQMMILEVSIIFPDMNFLDLRNLEAQKPLNSKIKAIELKILRVVKV